MSRISVAIASRDRPAELGCILGAMSQEASVVEIVVLDNSQRPYLDNPLFVLLQDALSREGKALIFVRETERKSVVELKYLAVRRTTSDCVLVWDDDSLPLTPLNGLEGRLVGYGLLSFCFLDVVNYLGYSDWAAWVDPDELSEIIHPCTIMYRWFKSDKYDRIVTPWGGNGIFFVKRKSWVRFYEEQGHKEIQGKGVDFVPPEVVVNVAYLHHANSRGVIYFRDRLTNLYHPTQPREWDLTKFDETMSYLREKYIGEKKVKFIGMESGTKIVPKWVKEV